MALPAPLKKLIELGRTHWQWSIISGIIVAIAVSQPVLWPDGIGIKADESVTTTIEKDPLGNITKTVETTKIAPGKTLWDWLNLLGVPITLAILGYWLQQIQQKHAEEEAKEQRELAADETKEEVLQVYFDRLSALLVDKNLLAIADKVNSEKPEKLQATREEQELLDSAVDVIRARTLSIFRRFENDKERKNSVIRFLIEADFISKLKINLSGADLSGAHLSYANLSGAHLSGADLSSAHLGEANLSYANLSGADLSGADLSGAHLIGANLSYAHLSSADLNGTHLSYAHLIGTHLSYANFSNADLNGAHLSYAHLSYANFSDADLSGAHLIDANFSAANLSYADLSAANLSGADFSYADLSSADLSYADLSGTNFSNANLGKMKNFSSEQINSAKNWGSATYDGRRLDDPEVRKQLGLDSKP
jgi:uncharacterized protein YjbI with pentapeptide repeats